MLERLKERLKQLENKAAANIAARYPDDADGFVVSVVGADHAEQYMRGNGYDVMAMLNDTAADDWRGYAAPDDYSEECREETI